MTFDGRVVVEIDTISGLLFRALYSIYWIKIISIFRRAKMEMECGGVPKSKIVNVVIVFLSGFCGHIYNVGVARNLSGVYN
jgi:hypothetical protein